MFIKLTQLESGTPCWVRPEDVSMINSGTKTLPVEQIEVGKPYEFSFSKLSLKNGASVMVREDEKTVVLACNPK